ncbi:MAG: DUF1858 domain-containing protein [Gemmatimonadota bacterium]|nr:MAG: DUF1858 domain-containing protein [Gemmatimonadota bacterium]
MQDKNYLKRRETAVTLDTPVEDLAQQHPAAVDFLNRRNIRCIRCGEPLWCTLGELLQKEGVPNLRQFLEELNDFLSQNDERK